MASNRSNDSHISYISRIPHEILSFIFIELLNLPLTECDLYPNPRFRPLYLASVCQIWRQVACNTSELWVVCCLNHSQTQLNGIWLSRTGRREFDIDATLLSIRSGEPVHCPKGPILLSIAPYMDRCRSLSMESCLFSSKEWEKYQFFAPNLVSYKSNDWNSSPSPWVTKLLHHAPKLEDLNLDTLPADMNIPYTNLKNLTLRHSPKSDRLLSILEKATNLCTLIIDYELEVWDLDPVSDDYYIHTAITNTSLFHLQLFCEYLCGLAMFFDLLTLPSLKSLTISLLYADIGQEEISLFHSFLRRSQCLLEELSLAGYEGYDNLQLVDILQHETLTSLQTLVLSTFMFDEPFLHFLSNASNLPFLRKLYIDEAWLDKNSHSHSLSNMLIARRTAGVERSGRPSIPVLEHFRLSIAYDHCCTSLMMEQYEDEVLRIEKLRRPSGDPEGSFIAELGKMPCSR